MPTEPPPSSVRQLPPSIPTVRLPGTRRPARSSSTTPSVVRAAGRRSRRYSPTDSAPRTGSASSSQGKRAGRLCANPVDRVSTMDEGRPLRPQRGRTTRAARAARGPYGRRAKVPPADRCVHPRAPRLPSCSECLHIRSMVRSRRVEGRARREEVAAPSRSVSRCVAGAPRRVGKRIFARKTRLSVWSVFSERRCVIGSVGSRRQRTSARRVSR